jgi:hypothetical protein
LPANHRSFSMREDKVGGGRASAFDPDVGLSANRPAPCKTVDGSGTGKGERPINSLTGDGCGDGDGEQILCPRSQQRLPHQGRSTLSPRFAGKYGAFWTVPLKPLHAGCESVVPGLVSLRPPTSSRRARSSLGRAMKGATSRAFEGRMYPIRVGVRRAEQFEGGPSHHRGRQLVRGVMRARKGRQKRVPSLAARSKCGKVIPAQGKAQRSREAQCGPKTIGTTLRSTSRSSPNARCLLTSGWSQAQRIRAGLTPWSSIMAMLVAQDSCAQCACLDVMQLEWNFT